MIVAGSALAWGCAALALLPLTMAWANLRCFVRPTTSPPAGTRVSILIPARDEAATIEAAVEGALKSEGVDVEVVVLDDDSSDATGAIVVALAARDARVRLLRAPALPAGWAGKQRACHLLSGAARHDVLMFVDADVQLAPQAAALAAGHLLAQPGLGMVSGFPYQLTLTWSEQLAVPWIHLLLLGYLPMSRMRRSDAPAYAAACGQWIVARRNAYRQCGGHAAAPVSRHDGISLPRAFRRAGWRTDVFDGSALASCRMYESFPTLWRGFGKSAGEGMATPLALPVWTVLLAGGHVLPTVLLAAALVGVPTEVIAAGVLGVGANLLLRGLLCARLGLSWRGALLHPVGALLVLLIQWSALLRHLAGRPSVWRGRGYLRNGARSGA